MTTSVGVMLRKQGGVSLQKVNPPACEGVRPVDCDTADLEDSSHFLSLNEALI